MTTNHIGISTKPKLNVSPNQILLSCILKMLLVPPTRGEQDTGKLKCKENRTQPIASQISSSEIFTQLYNHFLHGLGRGLCKWSVMVSQFLGYFKIATCSLPSELLIPLICLSKKKKIIVPPPSRYCLFSYLLCILLECKLYEGNDLCSLVHWCFSSA